MTYSSFKVISLIFCLGTKVPRLSAGVRTYVVRQARAIKRHLQCAHDEHAQDRYDRSLFGVSEVSLLPEASDILAKDKISKPWAEARV